VDHASVSTHVSALTNIPEHSVKEVSNTNGNSAYLLIRYPRFSSKTSMLARSRIY